MSTQNIYDLADIWNAGATTFTAIKMNVTDTASSAGSLLLDLQVGGTSQFKVSKAGEVTANSSIIAGDGAGLKILKVNGAATGTNAGARLDIRNGDTINIAIGNSSAIIGGAYDNTTLFYSTANMKFRVGGATEWLSVGTDNVNFGSVGITVGTPTGGNQGAGTINATAVYDDGVLLTCYVLEHWLDGSIDTAAWDARIPNREHPAQTKVRETGEINENGFPIFETVETAPAYTEVRQHLPARGFAQVADARLNIDQFRQFLTEHRRLPAFPGPDRWADMFNGKMSTGDVLQRLWETIEVLAVHSCKARERELALEARIADLENRA